MRTCDECGAGMPKGAAFCPACGREQAARDDAVEQPAGAGAPSEARARRRRGIIIGVAALAGVLAVAGAAAFLLSGRDASGALVSLTTRRPVAGATLQTEYGVATTDRAGRFVLSKLPLGTQVVTVTADGFEPFRSEVRIGAFGRSDSEIALPDASAIVRLEETAKRPEAVAEAKVLVNGRAAARVATGTYELRGLPPGPVAIAVTAAGHEPTKTTVALESGDNTLPVRLQLTPAETCDRYFLAYKASDWKSAYAHLHPDAVEGESLGKFTKDMQKWGKPVSLEVEGVKMLPKWTMQANGVTYTRVAEVKRTLIVEKGAMRIVGTEAQHWVNVGGFWLRVDL